MGNNDKRLPDLPDVPEVDRRRFMKWLGAMGVTGSVATTLLNPWEGHEVAQASGGEDAEHRWVMVIDLNKCIGCKYCVYACQATNDVTDAMQWNVYLLDETETGEQFHMTRPCLHCQDAPCAHVCPTKATFQRGDGPVIIDYDKCIGCRYCMVACPYDVRRFNWDNRDRSEPANDLQPEWGYAEIERRPRGVVEKCTFCLHRLDRGLEAGLTPGEDRAATPACVNICPVEARTFGDLFDPNSRVAQQIATMPTFRLKEELGTEPNVYYIPPEGMVTI